MFQHIHEIYSFGPKKETNSYPTLQDEQNTVEEFLNRIAQEAILLS